MLNIIPEFGLWFDAAGIVDPCESGFDTPAFPPRVSLPFEEVFFFRLHPLWFDDNHIAAKSPPKLWDFIEMRLPEVAPDSSNMSLLPRDVNG